nr:hypothetical protein [Salmonella bongori]
MHIHRRQWRQGFACPDAIVACDHAHLSGYGHGLLLKSTYRAAGKGIDQYQHAVDVGMCLP